MTNMFTLISNPQGNSPAPQADAGVQKGNADSRKLAKDWAQGKGNTKDSNFVTPGDKADPRTVEKMMKDKGMAPGFSGDK